MVIKRCCPQCWSAWLLLGRRCSIDQALLALPGGCCRRRRERKTGNIEQEDDRS